jgi:ubiquitin C-terminal hydrolase
MAALGSIALENNNSLCWANAVVQLLTPDDEFWTAADAQQGGIFAYLYEVQKHKWNDTQRYMTADMTCQAILSTRVPDNIPPTITMDLQRQQDAHEFMVHVLDMGHSTATEGRIQRTCTCDVCGHQSIKIETFRQLDVRNLADITAGSHQMNRFIRSQIAVEHLIDDNAWECDRCCQQQNNPKLRQPATIQSQVLHWPPYLIINVARFIMAEKDNTAFDFPTWWHGRRDTDPRYKLMTMIVHAGRQAKMGHYIAYGRVGKEWRLYDDTAIHRVSLGQVTGEGNQRNCYQLLYKRQ